MPSNISFYIFSNNVKYGYHLTLRSKMGEIIKNGLIPQCGPNSKRVNDNSVGVHFALGVDEIYEFWMGELYGDTNEPLELLRFPLKNRNIIQLSPASYPLPGDFIALNRIKPEVLEYLVDMNNALEYDEEKHIWLPVKQYIIHK